MPTRLRPHRPPAARRMTGRAPPTPALISVVTRPLNLALLTLPALFALSCGPSQAQQPSAQPASAHSSAASAAESSESTESTLALSSQSPATPVPPNLPVRPAPILRIPTTDGATFDPLTLTALHIRIAISGSIAETVMTMEFHNPNDRPLTGELVLPLAEGVTVSGYALNIPSLNDRMVDAVVVEKDKARVVFEKEVRRGVDPGIVEWVGGNSFRTRVYPIPARGSRRIAVTTVRALNPRQRTLAYRLPLNLPASVKRLGLELEASSQAQVLWRGVAAVPLKQTGAQNHRQRSGQRPGSGTAEQGELRISLPRRGNVVASQTDSYGDTSFAILDSLVHPGTENPKDRVGLRASTDALAPSSTAQADPAPRSTDGSPASVAITATGQAASRVSSVTIFWDTSHSRAALNHGRALDALQTYFAALHEVRSVAEAKARPVQVNVVLFSNEVWRREKLRISAGDITPLRALVADLPYDGGTQLGVVAAGPKLKADVYWLVSDGLSSFGESLPADFSGPVHTLSLADTANSAFLRWMSERSGGHYFNLAEHEPRVTAAAVASTPLSLIAIKILNGEVTSLLPKPGKPMQSQLEVYGRLLSDEALIEVVMGRGGKPTITRRYRINKREATSGGTIARLWAQKRVAELSAFPKKNAQTLVALGKRYSLVTPGTSLIVLETLEQFVEHRIRPPRSLQAMRASYDAAMVAQRATEKKVEESKLQRVQGLWLKRINWWQTKFAKNYREPKVRPAKKARRRDRRSSLPAPSASSTARPLVMDDVTAAAPRNPVPEMEERDEIRLGKGAGAADPGPTGPQIELKPWNPDTPYLKRLRQVPAARRYAVYLKQKGEYGASPAFYLDCADFFFRQKDQVTGLRVLSTLADLELEDAALARVMAHKLSQLGYFKLARLLFEEVLRWRPEEPQSYRDLALVLAEEKSFMRSMKLLNRVVMNRWDRFSEIELIALMEINRLIPRAKAAGIAAADIPLHPSLIKLLDVDIRISLSWDADLTDIDMWVIEPSGEKAYYNNSRTHIGGLVSRDFTQGYGPEEYVIRHAMRGSYKVQANYYGSRAQTLTGAVTIQLDLYSNYGRKSETKKSITLRLDKAKDVITVGTLKF